MKMVFSFTFLISCLALANAGQESAHGAGHEGGIPEVVYYQAINVGIIAVGMFFMLRKGVVAAFRTKKAEFLEAASKAERAVKAAQVEHEEIRIKLQKLENNTEESLSRAKAEAVDLRNSIIAEAEMISKRIREEAALSAKMEVEKVKNQLREQMIIESMEAAKKMLEQKVGTAEQEMLQKNFTNDIQAVKP